MKQLNQISNRLVFKSKSALLYLLTTLLCISLSSYKSNAQNPIQLMNEELRLMFSNLSNPNPDVRFLYDMSAKVTDSIYYTNISYDTSNVDNWFNIYSEMYYAAYDTTMFLPVDMLFQNSFSEVQAGLIPIGIIDWNYNKLKMDALSTDNYFIFDTINNLIYDKSPRDSSPYLVDTLFTASPLVREVPFANVNFKISLEFLFTDPTTLWGPDDRKLEIDFDDGNGWIDFNINFSTIHQVIYPSSGLKRIKTRVLDMQTSQMICHSTAVMNVLSDQITVPPDDVITGIPDLDIGIYDNNCNPNAMKKYVVYLEGFDILNNKSVEEIYAESIQRDDIAQLRNFGYTFVVVSWQNPYAKIQDNAMRVVQLLDYLKCLTDSVAPFVVIGESMGGLVGRYALNYMESTEYAQGKERWNCKIALKHHTRLFIANDSPHQGANIPLGIQQLYKNVGDHLAFLLSPFAQGLVSIYNNQFLNAPAAKQMLIYHTETETTPYFLINTSTYTASNLRTTFLNDMANLGNYPKYCKIVALSDGAFDGSRQTPEWSNDERVANDILLALESDFYLKGLGRKFIGSYFDFTVRTNPNGTGSILTVNKGVSHWKLKLYWFGIKIVWDHTTLIKIDKRAKNVLPYCVNAGSFISDYNTVPSGNPVSSTWEILLGLSYNYQISNDGNIHFQGSITPLLFPWVSHNAALDAHTDGFRFGFIPVQSSFDYQAANPTQLNYPIHNDPVSDIMQRTPFDVVYTSQSENRRHMAVDNPSLSIYNTCVDEDGGGIGSFLLTREIGDDSLWLENTVTLPEGYLIETEQDLLVNYRNIYYNYPSQNSSITDYQINNLYYVISKEEPVTITNLPLKLRANNGVHINPSDPLIGSYQITSGFMIICCEDFRFRSPTIEDKNNNLPLKSSKIEVYPNPVTSSVLTVKYNFGDNLPVTMYVYDLQGRLLEQIEMPFADNTLDCFFSINLKKSNLQAGVYLLKASNGKETLHAKVIVTK